MKMEMKQYDESFQRRDGVQCTAAQSAGSLNISFPFRLIDDMQRVLLQFHSSSEINGSNALGHAADSVALSGVFSNHTAVLLCVAAR